MALSGGLAITNQLTSARVHVDMFFEPSVGISAKKLDKLGMDIRSFREPLHRSIKQVVIPSIRENFDVGGRPAWSPLEFLTSERRTKEGYGAEGPILVRTGTLRKVATQLNIWTIGREVAMVTDLPDKAWYGKVHQAGATFSVGGGSFAATPTQFLTWQGKKMGQKDKAQGKIPARPFIMVQNSDIPKIELVFQLWLGERIKAAGL